MAAPLRGMAVAAAVALVALALAVVAVSTWPLAVPVVSAKAALAAMAE